MARKSIFLLSSGLALTAIVGGVILAKMTEAPSFAAQPAADTQAGAQAALIPEPRIEAGGKPFRDRFKRYRRDRWLISNGWRNGQWTINDWQRSQAKFDDGLTMTLEERLSPRADYAGAELQTRKRFGHGYYEVEMRSARASGVVSAFFTYTGPPFGDPWNEIDVEILGSKPREVMFTYFRDGDKIEHIHQLGFDASQGFHTYAFDWQPQHLRWYVDGKLVHESSTAEMRFPNMPQKMMTSIWGSEKLTEWVGPFDKKALPVSMMVKCIAYAEDYASRKPCVEAN